jgi:hypothetical protein
LYGSGGFFAKYHVHSGKLDYAKNVGNSAILCLAKFQNKLYIGGDFSGVIDADPGQATAYIGSYEYSNNHHAVIGQYNAKNGDFIWAKGLITTAFIGPRKVLADASGVYVSGYFAGSVDFDGDEAEANRSSSQIDAFGARYESETGTLRWAKGVGSPGRAVSIAAALTSTGYYLGGLFGETVNFDPYTGSAYQTSMNGTHDIFVAKYAANETSNTSLTAARAAETKNNFSENQISGTIYPNPANDVITLKLKGFAEGPVELTIADVLGKMTIKKSVTSRAELIDVSSLSSGLHFLRATQGARSFTGRFIKK